MVDVNNNIIKITRGDTCVINLAVYESDGETPYEPQAGDTFYLTVKPDINNEYYSIKKEFDNMSIYLSVEDTIKLNFGSYFFDIRLENGTNHDTILCNGEFIIERGTANYARS